MLYRETFAEILCPETVYDLVDYLLLGLKVLLTPPMFSHIIYEPVQTNQ